MDSRSHSPIYDGLTKIRTRNRRYIKRGCSRLGYRNYSLNYKSRVTRLPPSWFWQGNLPARLIGPYRFFGLSVCPVFFFEKFFSNVTECFGSYSPMAPRPEAILSRVHRTKTQYVPEKCTVRFSIL